jgi:hypothetical protein
MPAPRSPFHSTAFIRFSRRKRGYNITGLERGAGDPDPRRRGKARSKQRAARAQPSKAKRPPSNSAAAMVLGQS